MSIPSPHLLFCSLLTASTLVAAPPGDGELPADVAELSALARQKTDELTSWEQIQDAIKNGRTWLNLRYRFENVDQGDAFDKDAHASTLRTVLGYETGTWRGFNALVEFEDVHAVGDDAYNSTRNGETDRPTVLDPEGGEVNQAMLRYAVDENTSVSAGRQRVTLSNHRFVGNVGWRQNEQTYDGLTVDFADLGSAQLTYGYVTNVNRISGEGAGANGNLQGSNHLAQLQFPVSDLGTLNLYTFMLDFDDAPALSTRTIGASFDGQHGVTDGTDVTWWLELADQSDGGDNPNSVDAGYMRAEVGVAQEAWFAKVGNELLEGSGDPGDAFTTPLATLHKFNGWADMFLNTPDTGLNDFYLAVGGTVADTKLEARWHDFTSDSGDIDYGTEIDFAATREVARDTLVGLKFADYSSDDLGTDTTKAWLWIGWSF